MAPFDAWYAGRWGSADFDELAEMFTIEPLPALRISGIAYLHAQTDPISATRRMLVEGVVVDLVDVTVLAAPDVVGRDRVVHQRRQAAVALDRRRDRPGDVLLDAVVGADVHRLSAGVVDAGLHRAPVILGAAGERDRGALGREHLHDPLADAPGAPGDQRDLAVEPHVESPLLTTE